MTLAKTAALPLVAAALAACDGSNPDTQKIANQAEQQVERAAATLDDGAITGKVKSALIADPDLRGLSIDVDTTQNVVTLRGTVASDDMRKKAERLTRGVEGVKEVKNELGVKPA